MRKDNAHCAPTPCHHHAAPQIPPIPEKCACMKMTAQCECQSSIYTPRGAENHFVLSIHPYTSSTPHCTEVASYIERLADCWIYSTAAADKVHCIRYLFALSRTQPYGCSQSPNHPITLHFLLDSRPTKPQHLTRRHHLGRQARTQTRAHLPPNPNPSAPVKLPTNNNNIAQSQRLVERAINKALLVAQTAHQLHHRLQTPLEFCIRSVCSLRGPGTQTGCQLHAPSPRHRKSKRITDTSDKQTRAHSPTPPEPLNKYRHHNLRVAQSTRKGLPAAHP